jgi:Protein of unknown function (DUF2844)
MRWLLQTCTKATFYPDCKSNLHQEPCPSFMRWTHKSARIFFAAPMLALALTWALPAFATLGQDVSSIQTDRLHLNASERVMTSQLYSVHEMQTPSGTTVRQYVSSGGTVFAVSWKGFPPDLRQLLGDHFDEYMTAASGVMHRGRGAHIETGDLVFESGGHMRYVVGRALLRSKMPSGVSRDEIR